MREFMFDIADQLESLTAEEIRNAAQFQMMKRLRDRIAAETLLSTNAANEVVSAMTIELPMNLATEDPELFERLAEGFGTGLAKIVKEAHAEFGLAGVISMAGSFSLKYDV